ncbi:MAG: GNAT family N-acetyltransferase, partial [Massilia sp.]|nr:GNAT family N-acetyltransferase [Massilia sp.]
MKPAVAIRDLGAGDVDALLALYEHLNAGDAPPSQEAVLAVFSHPGLRHFGLFDGDRLIASCNLAAIPNLTRGGTSYGVIENVVTHADHRGQGHGLAIV